MVSLIWFIQPPVSSSSSSSKPSAHSHTLPREGDSSQALGGKASASLRFAFSITHMFLLLSDMAHRMGLGGQSNSGGGGGGILSGKGNVAGSFGRSMGLAREVREERGRREEAIEEFGR